MEHREAEATSTPSTHRQPGQASAKSVSGLAVIGAVRHSQQPKARENRWVTGYRLFISQTLFIQSDLQVVAIQFFVCTGFNIGFNISAESASLITGGRLFHRQGARYENALFPADFLFTFGIDRRPTPEDWRGREVQATPAWSLPLLSMVKRRSFTHSGHSSFSGSIGS